MPLYEYRCEGCRRKVTVYVRSLEREQQPCCPVCGGAELTRMFSTFRTGRTDKDVYEDILGDRSLVGRMMANDPRALVEWNRRMSGDEKVAPEYEEMLGKMEAGEWPDELTGRRKAPAEEAGEDK